jgi:hypothetical protein
VFVAVSVTNFFFCPKKCFSLCVCVVVCVCRCLILIIGMYLSQTFCHTILSQNMSGDSVFAQSRSKFQRYDLKRKRKREREREREVVMKNVLLLGSPGTYDF